jgi:hypothetical protein
MPLSALTSTTARYEEAGFAKLVDAGVTMGANPTPASKAKKYKMAAAVPSNSTRYTGFQRPTACCLCGARLKYEK